MAKYYSPEGNLEEWAVMPDGYYTVDEWEEAHPRPIPTPTEPTTEDKLSELNAQYDADKAILIEQYTDSLMNNDTEMAEELKAELAALNEQYDADYEAIINGEE